MRALKVLGNNGCNVYYVVGNHDIILENFFDDWGNIKIAPFLNVISGGRRIRVEHGHLYDPLFVRHPRLYEFLTRLAGIPLRVSPRFYKAWIAFRRFSYYHIIRRDKVILGEPRSFAVAAHELARRGFDCIIFGHTHHVNEVDLGDGKRYFNPGSSMNSSSCAEVVNGKVCLLDWDYLCG